MPSLIFDKKMFDSRYAGTVMCQNSSVAFILHQNEASVIAVSVRTLYIGTVHMLESASAYETSTKVTNVIPSRGITHTCKLL